MGVRGYDMKGNSSDLWIVGFYIFFTTDYNQLACNLKAGAPVAKGYHKPKTNWSKEHQLSYGGSTSEIGDRMGMLDGDC